MEDEYRENQREKKKGKEAGESGAPTNQDSTRTATAAAVRFFPGASFLFVAPHGLTFPTTCAQRWHESRIQFRHVKLSAQRSLLTARLAGLPPEPACSPGRAGDGGGGRLGFGGGGAAAAGAGGREGETRRGDVGADAGERGGIHRRHRRARPPLRLPRRRVARGLRRRRRRRLRHALLHAPTRQYSLPIPSLPPLLTLLSAPERSTVQCRVLFPVIELCFCMQFVRLLTDPNRS